MRKWNTNHAVGKTKRCQIRTSVPVNKNMKPRDLHLNEYVP